MKKIFSFKRLLILKPDVGWRYFANRWGVIIILCALLVTICFLSTLIFSFGVSMTITLLLSLGCGIIFASFDVDERFWFVKEDTKTKIRISVYRAHSNNSLYRIDVKRGNECTIIGADEYEWLKFKNSRGFFIYKYHGVWYRLTTRPELLGERIGKVMFVDKTSNYRICILDMRDKVDVSRFIRAGKAYYGEKGLNVPEMASLDAIDKDFVLIKDRSMYKLISSCYQKLGGDGSTYIAEERFKSAIFVEDGKTVVLVWDEKMERFKEIYRKKNPIDSLKLIIDVKCGNKKFIEKGIIYKFDTRTKVLRAFYQGRIFRIDHEKRQVCVGTTIPYSY